jgi:hypothetical protein
VPQPITNDAIHRRRVFHVPGFDPSPLPVVKQRFARQLRCFEQTWSVKTSMSPSELKNSWNVVASGPNWRTETVFSVVNWNHVVQDILDRPTWLRIPQGLWAFADFSLNALPSYLRENWCYACFFLYPFLTFFALGALALFAGALAAGATGFPIAGILVSVIALALLWRWPGRYLLLHILFDDWIFSQGYLRKGNPTLEARLDRAAQEIVAAVQRNEADEIVVIGHSLGAPVSIDLLDRALQLEPALGQEGPCVALITVGSSNLKIGLHSAATRFRTAAERVSSAPGVFWGEYQADSDVMNFHKRNPFTAMNLPPRDMPLLRMVRVQEWSDQLISVPLHLRPFRMHMQFVMGNNLRNAYDYFMLVCGPLHVEHQMRGDGALSALGPDGRLKEGSSRPVKMR